MSIAIDLLEEVLIYTLNNDLLANIFKDLLWGIIRYKEDNWEDSSERLRGFIEHSHRALYEELIDLTSNPLYLDEYEKSASKLHYKLRNYIFWNLYIDQVLLLDENRNDYKFLATKFHKIISYANKLQFLPIMVNCIKLMLLTEEIIFYLNENKQNKLKSIRIEAKYQDFLSLKDTEIIETLLDIVFSRKIRDLLIQKSILDYNHIQNSRILQKYYPYYIIEHLRIENLLSEKNVHPFRPVGPHLIDFEVGNWLFIPFKARHIKKILEIKRRSILISAISGTGKTIISRWIGYRLYSKGFDVFYIDCLDLKSRKIEAILNQILLLKKKKSSKTLFIFENVHILEEDLRNKLVRCKDEILCLITERISNEYEEKSGDFRQKFENNQKVKILINRRSFKRTINGIINLNSSKDAKLIFQLKNIGNQNLWIYAIILKLFKESLNIKQNASIINILTNHQQIGDRISDYFQNLIKKKSIKDFSSKDVIYLNHIHYILGILSIFSEYELWTEDKFFDYIISINDNTPLGLYNSDLRIDKDILKEVQAFLIDLFEISKRTVDIKPGIKQKEFRIPHSQMAKIYRNTIFKVIEKSYPSLHKNILYLYIYHGNYYGQVLNNKYHEVYFNKRNQPQPGDVFSLAECKEYSGEINLDTFLNKFHENMKNQSLREINIFNERCLFSKCIEDSKQNYIKALFERLIDLDDYYWGLKLESTNPRSLYYFLESINDYLGNKYLIEFFDRFNQVILKKIPNIKLDLIIKLMFLLFEKSEDMSNKYHNDFKDLILRNIESYEDFRFSINFVDNFKERTLANTYIHEIIKEKLNQYLYSSNLEVDLRLLSERNELILSIYNEFLKKVVQEKKFIDLFRNKLIKSDFGQLNSYIYTQTSEKSELINNLLVLFFKEIKDLFEKADLKNISDLLVEIKYIKKTIPDFKDLIFQNWDWFLNLLSKFNAYEIMNNYNSISKHFLGAFDKDYQKRFEGIINSVMIEKVEEYYDSLAKKYEICKLLIENDLLDQIKGEIYSLFTTFIKETLENPSTNLVDIIQIFTELRSNHKAFSIFIKDYDFELINSNKSFKKIIESANEDSLFKFMGFLKDNADEWYELLTQEHRDFLKDKYGNCFEVAHLCSKEGRDLLKRIPQIVQDLDIESINIVYNSTYRTFYPIKYSWKATDNMIEVHTAFLKEVSQNINMQKEIFLSNEMGKLIEKIDSTNLFNFLLIFHKFHLDLLKEMYNMFQQTVKDNLTKEPINPLVLFGILETYEISIFGIKEILDEFFEDGFFNELFMNTLRKIDLFSLRAYISFLAIPYLSRNDRTEEIEYLKSMLDFNQTLKNSNLLQIALGLHLDSISLLKKPSGLMFLKGQKRTRQIRLEPKEFEVLTKHMRFLEDNTGKDFTHIGLNEAIPYDKESILNPPIFYSEIILDKIKISNLHDISQYMETLVSWISEASNILLKLPSEFLDYFNSESFSEIIKEANSDDVFLFFEASFKLFPKITADLWLKHQDYFIQEEFIVKTEKNYYKEIFNFNTLIFSDLSQVPAEIIETIKFCLKRLNFDKLLYALAGLNEREFEFHVVNFKSSFEDIIQNSSRQEINHALRQYKFWEKNNEILKMILYRIQLIEAKKQEKYFFE